MSVGIKQGLSVLNNSSVLHYSVISNVVSSENNSLFKNIVAC
jgi:hypothetical protein